jgi:hypothetical protein
MSKARNLADLGDDFDGTDLTLSGGVYLGGTGSANLLDDYEEGTWTPILKLGSTVVTQSSAVARYTKIGRQVTAFFETYTTNLNSGSGTFNISGLPFNNIAGMRSAQTQFFFQFMSSSFPSGQKQSYIGSNGADISVGYFTGSSGTAAVLNESHFTTSSYVYANITYFTN